ncbi:MAG: DUF2520 domain-containing protein [Saprospiraceae bacterium]
MEIGIAGSGNMAYRLVPALQHVGLRVGQIWNRSQNSDLATKYQLKMCTQPEDMEANMLFICVSDDAITEVAEKFKNFKGTVVHTSGSVSSAVLNSFKHYGVMWPVQTMTRQGRISFEKIPLCITTSDADTQEFLAQVAGLLSDRVYPMNDEQRLRVHLTAVMTNNFMNHLAILSRDYLQNNNLDYEIIVPLIRTTLEKITNKPYNFEQTGPAHRNDQRVIQSHLTLLEKDASLQKLYQIITESIQSHAHH